MTLEILATVLTVACVLLANKRSLWQYPVGILGTVLFFFVVWQANLYANAALQVVFTGVQVYGWWYWLRGDQGKRPPIRRFGIADFAIVMLCTVALSFSASLVLAGTNAALPTVDCIVFGLSILAQFLLDRKRIEHWYAWAAVNVLSVYLYAHQGLWVFTALYAALFINCFVGYRMWRTELDGYGIGERWWSGYGVITSGISPQANVVWEGTITLRANTPHEAELAILDLLENRPEYDRRIDPAAHVFAVTERELTPEGGLA